MPAHRPPDAEATRPEPELLVRIASPADVAALAMLRSSWSGDGSSEGELREALGGWLAAEGERRTTWLAELGGAPAGMVSLFEYRRMPWPGRLDSRWGYVGNMFVREELRRRGVAGALLQALVAAAEARSYARLVVSPSEQAYGLYGGAGFAVADGQHGELLLVRTGREPAARP
jgi:GNAT superfamily N-acetyltransferase